MPSPSESPSPDTEFRLRNFENNKHVMGYIDQLNIFLQRKKPRVLDAKSIQPDKKKSITDSIFSETVRAQGMWRFPKDKEPVYAIKYIEPPKTMRGKSAHNVFFAEARIGGVDAEIAVKPFVTPEEGEEDIDSSAPQNSLTEFININLVAEKGIFTFKPIASIIDKKTGFLLTCVEHGIRSLDQQSWPNYITEPNKEIRDEVSGKLEKVSICLADMHKKGIVHGDAQIKNFATTPDGTIFPIDWEAAKVYKNMTRDQFLAGAEKDLVNLLESLYRLPEKSDKYKYSGIGILHVSNPKQYVWHPFNKLVFQPYVDELLFKKKNASLSFDIVEAGIELEKNIKERAQSPGIYTKR